MATGKAYSTLSGVCELIFLSALTFLNMKCRKHNVLKSIRGINIRKRFRSFVFTSVSSTLPFNFMFLTFYAKMFSPKKCPPSVNMGKFLIIYGVYFKWCYRNFFTNLCEAESNTQISFSKMEILHIGHCHQDEFM